MLCPSIHSSTNTRWLESAGKLEALEHLYEENASHLELEADEDTKIGNRFINFHDRVKESAHGDKRLYNAQLESIHCVVSEVTRT